MNQITITREEFMEKIVNNPESYGLVRAMRKDPERMKGRETGLLLEEIKLALTLREVEMDLFGPEE